MSNTNCEECQLEISDQDSIITCFICEKTFHGFKCLGLSRTSLKTFREVPGLLWCCDKCRAGPSLKYSEIVLKKLCDISDRTVSNSQDELLKRFDQLSTEVSNIKKTVEGFGETEAQNPNAKRLRSGILKPMSPRQPVASDWPRIANKPPRLIMGTDVETTTLKVVEQPIFYHVSRFDPTTTEVELQEYIEKKLDIPKTRVQCTRLVPKGREEKDLNFITFKVGIPKSFEPTFFLPTTWPANITVRPFEQRNSSFLARPYPKPLIPPQNQSSPPEEI